MTFSSSMKLSIIFISLVLAAVSCSDNKTQERPIPTQQEVARSLEELNRQKMRDESAQIDGFVDRINWPMLVSGTGLRYWIYESGEGLLAQEGQIAKVSYVVSLLNGDTLYTSLENGPKEFLIGQDNVETGLHEGILYLHQGDKAKFILPSHLAHGLSGDQDKIPPRHSVVYDIELLSLR
jgi:FKBP-type peptidyl-prolyl cis-trans isomerase FkpA